MAKVNRRRWKVPGQRAKQKAWGFTIQVPCDPCPHRHPEKGHVLHPDGVRQVKSYRSEWTEKDAEAELAKVVLGIEQAPARSAPARMTLGEAVERYLKA